MRYILDAARDVLSRFGGGNIFETAEKSGANVWFRRLGGLKGFYISENGCRYIVINEELDEVMRAVVCAHELGHDMLHRELSAGGIREGTLFLSGNKTEREANIFAASLLISDEEVLCAPEYCDSAEKLAAFLGFPRELVLFKLEAMNFEGHNFSISRAESDFLK